MALPRIRSARRFWPADSIRSLKGRLPQGGRLPDEAWRARHRGILALLWTHAVAVPIYGIARGYAPRHVLVESLILPIAALVGGIGALPRRTRTMAAAVGLLSASGILVHLSRGLIEMHFHFFVMVVVVSLYQDWLPFLAAIAYVLVHHGLVGVIDPRSVYNHPAAIAHPWKWAAVHALFITGISAASLVAWRLNEVHLARRREAEDRLRIISEASREFLATLDLDSVLGKLAELVVPAVADVCIIDVVGEDGAIRRLGPVTSPEHVAVLTAVQSLPPDPSNARHPVVQAIRSKASVLITEIRRELIDSALGDSPHLDQLRELVPFAGSAISVPLVARDRVIAVMTAATFGRHPRELGPDEISLMDEIARRAAAAAENAALYAAQREAAETLQHSLLPERLPELPAIELGARYVAGGPGTDVGGDWYDIVTLGDGSIGLVMGDVVGRGIPAASVMGQLRHALRAFALEGLPPAEVMDRLNSLLESLDVTDQMATVCYGVFDLETGGLSLANAGHPPPIVLSPDGACSLLDDVGGVPLGVRSGSRYEQRHLTLGAGDTLLLYTDGLAEDRDTPLDVGIEAVCRAAREHRGKLETLCDRVLAEATAGRTISDDVALLALRYAPFGDRMDLTLPAQPWILRPLRSALRRWLNEAGATEEEAFGLLVAAGEACSNVIRHASPRVATFDIHGERVGHIKIDVRDRGRWREPTPRTFGGRGLHIIEEFVDDLQLTKGPPETIVSMRRTLAPRVSA